MSTLDQWCDDVIEALHLDAAGFDRDLLLDLTRDVAHGVTRPAAPLTAYLVGLAAGANGGSDREMRDAVNRIRALLPSPAGETRLT